ncbi:hypothetical protein [Neisseria dumasiana]|uniref:hypothetical protein n=1 Tax=Neisseria dumasiana TaxID=1931275 RepID=UPI003F4E438C
MNNVFTVSSRFKSGLRPKHGKQNTILFARVAQTVAATGIDNHTVARRYRLSAVIVAPYFGTSFQHHPNIFPGSDGSGTAKFLRAEAATAPDSYHFPDEAQFGWILRDYPLNVLQYAEYRARSFRFAFLVSVIKTPA